MLFVSSRLLWTARLHSFGVYVGASARVTQQEDCCQHEIYIYFFTLLRCFSSFVILSREEFGRPFPSSTFESNIVCSQNKKSIETARFGLRKRISSPRNECRTPDHSCQQFEVLPNEPIGQPACVLSVVTDRNLHIRTEQQTPRRVAALRQRVCHTPTHHSKTQPQKGGKCTMCQYQPLPPHD